MSSPKPIESLFPQPKALDVSPSSIMRAVVARRDVLERLTAQAQSRKVPGMSDEDLVNEAIVRVLDGRCPWRPERQPDPVKHLGSVINSIAWDERTSARAHRETLDERGAREPGGGPTPEEAMMASQEEELDKEERAERVKELRKRLRGDKLALAVLRLYEEGIVDVTAQAERVGRCVEAVYKARKRIAYNAQTACRE